MSRPLRIAMRTDASVEMGTGHVRRCVSLATALGTCGAEVAFFVRDLGLDHAALGLDEWPHFVLPECAVTSDCKGPSDFPADPQARLGDAHRFLDAAAQFAPEIVIVDSYEINRSWHERVRAALDCRIVAIDDLGDRDLACDLLVDHNYCANHARKYAKRLPPGTQICGGPGFALLGPAYESAPRYAFEPSVRSIGIFLGGTDVHNASEAIARALRSEGYGGTLEIAASSVNPHLPALQAFAQGDGLVKVAVDLPDLGGFFARHDLQIGAGGGATWERFCIGAPSLLLAFNENQTAALAPLEELDIAAILYAPDASHVARNAMALANDVSRRQMFAKGGRALVDGLGARRVAEAVIG